MPKISHPSLANFRPKNNINAIQPLARLFLLVIGAFHLASRIGIQAEPHDHHTCSEWSDNDTNKKCSAYSKYDPTTYDYIHFPYLKSDTYSCTDLEKFMKAHDQPTIKTIHNIPNKIGVVTDCKLHLKKGVTHFKTFTQTIRKLLDNLELSDPDERDLIASLKETFEFILRNTDKIGPRYICIDLIKYYQLMNCEKNQKTCIVSDVDNSIPKQLEFSNPNDRFHLGKSDSPDFMVTQNSTYSIGKNAILFSLARAIPYLKIKSLHKDLDFKKVALDSSGHVVSIMKSLQTDALFSHPSFGPIMYDKTILNKVRSGLVSKVANYKQSGMTSAPLIELMDNYLEQNNGATMFLNHAGIRMLKLLAKQHSIHWKDSEYIKSATKMIQLMLANKEAREISLMTLELG